MQVMGDLAAGWVLDELRSRKRQPDQPATIPHALAPELVLRASTHPISRKAKAQRV
jgi:hypothetical protein